MAKERISHANYLQVVGLYALATSLMRQIKPLMDAVNEIVGGDQDDLDNYVNDVLWGTDNPTADELVKAMKIEVDPPMTREAVHFSYNATNNKCGKDYGENDTVTTHPDLVTCDMCAKYLEGFEAGKAVGANADS